LSLHYKNNPLLSLHHIGEPQCYNVCKKPAFYSLLQNLALRGTVINAGPNTSRKKSKIPYTVHIKVDRSFRTS